MRTKVEMQNSVAMKYCDEGDVCRRCVVFARMFTSYAMLGFATL